LVYFLTPYVDGRDLKGPVVISHIFLLIGCVIPLWFSLGYLPRTGSGYLSNWEVPCREISMVSGVIYVNMGDITASLIGRRYGRYK
jgi:dolichol kinase